jgi:uncharacterized RDD family membrane protein YckC
VSTQAPDRTTASYEPQRLPDYVWERKEGGASGPRAGFWRRFWAFAIDGILTAIVMYGLGFAIGPAGFLIGLLLGYVYYAAMEGGRSGQTVGKKALGIRVIDANTGRPIGFGRALVRNLARILSGLPLSLGYFWMLWDREKQTWHDKLASCHVVPIGAYPVD